MRKCLGILVVIILSIFCWNFDEENVPVIETPECGFLAQKDCSEGGYNDWNLPEISSSQVLFLPDVSRHPEPRSVLQAGIPVLTARRS